MTISFTTYPPVSFPQGQLTKPTRSNSQRRYRLAANEMSSGGTPEYG